jgi:hypothetical protein
MREGSEGPCIGCRLSLRKPCCDPVVCLSVNQRALDGLTKELREEENQVSSWTKPLLLGAQTDRHSHYLTLSHPGRPEGQPSVEYKQERGGQDQFP